MGTANLIAILDNPDEKIGTRKWASWYTHGGGASQCTDIDVLDCNVGIQGMAISIQLDAKVFGAVPERAEGLNRTITDGPLSCA